MCVYSMKHKYLLALWSDSPVDNMVMAMYFLLKWLTFAISPFFPVFLVVNTSTLSQTASGIPCVVMKFWFGIHHCLLTPLLGATASLCSWFWSAWPAWFSSSTNSQNMRHLFISKFSILLMICYSLLSICVAEQTKICCFVWSYINATIFDCCFEMWVIIVQSIIFLFKVRTNWYCVVSVVLPLLLRPWCSL